MGEKLKRIAKIIQIIALFILFFVIEIVCEILVVLFSSIVISFIRRGENFAVEWYIVLIGYNYIQI